MREYLQLAKQVLEEGTNKDDRTNTGTISLFGAQQRYDLSRGFPLVTTKKVHLKSIIHELLWFISGDTNIQYLVQNGVRIWNEWPYEDFKNSIDYNGETIEEFAELVKNDWRFAGEYGDLGPVYGRQWRNFFGFDQLEWVINEIKTNPDSRRLIISAWNPAQMDKMALPPCHAFMQFYVKDGRLSLQLYQRSADIFLGVPFNIASYSLFLMMVAQVTGLEPYEFIHTIGDAHIYSNHIEQIEEQLSRTPFELPQMKINPDIKDIKDFRYEDFKLVNYRSHPAIRAKVSV